MHCIYRCYKVPLENELSVIIGSCNNFRKQVVRYNLYQIRHFLRGRRSVGVSKLWTQLIFLSQLEGLQKKTNAKLHQWPRSVSAVYKEREIYLIKLIRKINREKSNLGFNTPTTIFGLTSQFFRCILKCPMFQAFL